MFFLRLIKGTFIRQWKKMSMIAFTIALGTSIATAMVNVMLDVSDKINEELKAYGANITVVSKEAAVLSDLYELEDDSLTRNMYLKEEVTGELLTIFWANNIRDFNPVLDGYVSLDGHKTTLVGSWFNHHLAYTKKGSSCAASGHGAGQRKKKGTTYDTANVKSKDPPCNRQAGCLKLCRQYHP